MTDGVITFLTESEQHAILSSPCCLRVLMDHIDIQHSEAESMLGADYGVEWPPQRWLDLRAQGQRIVSEDPELFDEATQRAFLDSH